MNCHSDFQFKVKAWFPTLSSPWRVLTSVRRWRQSICPDVRPVIVTFSSKFSWIYNYGVRVPFPQDFQTPLPLFSSTWCFLISVTLVWLSFFWRWQHGLFFGNFFWILFLSMELKIHYRSKWGYLLLVLLSISFPFDHLSLLSVLEKSLALFLGELLLTHFLSGWTNLYINLDLNI